MQPNQAQALKLNLVIIICAHREITCGTVTSLELLRLNSRLNYIVLPYSGDALIGRARSIAATHFIRKGLAPYMLFIDDDILFKPDDVKKIYRDLADGNDLVAGCYAIKDGTRLASYGFEDWTAFDGKLVDCRYLATGFMGISARLFKKIVEEVKIPLLHKGDWCECYPFFENRADVQTPMGAIWLSEDYDFCEKAIKVGVQPKLDTGVWLGHQGQKVYTMQDVSAFQAKIKQRVDNGEKTPEGKRDA